MSFTTAEAERLALELETDTEWMTVSRSEIAALLRSQAAESARLKELNAVAVEGLRVAADNMECKDALLRQALEALEKCYDVTDWPANGKSRQDAAIAAIHAAGIR